VNGVVLTGSPNVVPRKIPESDAAVVAPLP